MGLFRVFASQVTFVVILFCILETYKYFDGIIWPEILDENAASEYWLVAKAKSFFGLKSKSSSATPSEDSTSSHKGNIKCFSDQDHTEFRKCALYLYLSDILKDFTTATSKNDPVEIIRMVYAVYTSVSSSYLYYDNNEHIWNPSYEDTAEVIKQHYVSW